MIVNLYLDNQTAAILRIFGSINDMVNRIINEGMAGKFEMFDKPVAPSREECRRYEVHIENKEYIALISAYPEKSPKTSLRRLVTWFVENEMYAELNWQVSCDKRKRDTLAHRLDIAIVALKKYRSDFVAIERKMFDDAILACEKLGEKLYELQ